MSDLPNILVIAGPTGAGKTAAALAVAKAFDATVLSADAMQIYRHMDIGTAKATAQEQAEVPHVGIDILNPDQTFDAAQFIDLAQALFDAKKRVIVAGGTHFYVRAVIRGLVDTPPIDHPLRKELEQASDLHERLQKVDPVLAQRLHPNDRLRLVRGLEVFICGGQRLSELQAAHKAAPDKVKAIGLWLEREDLDERIDTRVLQMMEAGYLSEVSRLLERGYGRSLKPMQTLGYRHLAEHLLDGLSLDEAVRRTQRDTRHFARKQRTWLRKFDYEKVHEDSVNRALKAASALWS